MVKSDMFNEDKKNKREIVKALGIVFVLALCVKIFISFLGRNCKELTVHSINTSFRAGGVVAGSDWANEMSIMEERMKSIMDESWMQDSYFGRFSSRHEAADGVKTYIKDNGKDYIVTCSIPAIFQKRFSLKVKDRRLWICLKYKSFRKTRRSVVTTKVQEIEKEISLPTDVDMENFSPSYTSDKGLLEIRIGKI